MKTATDRYPGLEMSMGSPLGTHPKLAEIVSERVDEAIKASGWN